MALPSNNCSLLRHSYCRTSAVGILSSDWINFAVAADTADLVLCTAGLGPAGLGSGMVPYECSCTVSRTTLDSKNSSYLCTELKH